MLKISLLNLKRSLHFYWHIKDIGISQWEVDTPHSLYSFSYRRQQR